MLDKIINPVPWKTAAHIQREIITKYCKIPIIYFIDTRIHDKGKIYKFGVTNDISMSLFKFNDMFGSRCHLADAIDISTFNYKETRNAELAIRKYIAILRIAYPMDDIKNTIRVTDNNELLKISNIVRTNIFSPYFKN
jgi:hypothetical protein